MGSVENLLSRLLKGCCTLNAQYVILVTHCGYSLQNLGHFKPYNSMAVFLYYIQYEKFHSNIYLNTTFKRIKSLRKFYKAEKPSVHLHSYNIQ